MNPLRSERAAALFAGLAVVVGCAPAEEQLSPSPWIYADAPDDALPPSLTLAEVGQAIEIGFAAALDLAPGPVRDLFSTGLAAGDPGGCPARSDTVDGEADVSYWQDTCTASTGASFDGYGTVYVYDDLAAEGGLVLDGWAMLLAGELHTPDGASLIGSGALSEFAGGNGYYELSQRQVDGTFEVDGWPLDGDERWLDGSVRPQIEVSAAWVPEVTPETPTGLSGRQVVLGGAVDGLAGPAATVAFDRVVLTEAVLGSACDLEPSGTVSVRDPGGSWVDVVFDAPAQNGEPMDDPAACDGCGAAWFRGQDLGVVCVDVAPLLAWTGAPW